MKMVQNVKDMYEYTLNSDVSYVKVLFLEKYIPIKKITHLQPC